MVSPRPDPLVIRVLKEYRVLLDAREDALMADMARHWLTVQSSLDADIAALAYRMDELRREGKTITEQMVWREATYQRLKAQMEEQVKRYNSSYALPAIEKGQADNATMGFAAANDAISASFADMGALGPMWNRLNLNAVESMIGFARDGSPLKTLLKNDYPDAVDGLTKALINGMARGLNPAQIARDMRDGSSMGLERALLIARTESARAYRTGSTKQYRESGVVRGFKRLVKKETACMACLMLDGQEFDVEDELDDHPRGKCIAVPCVKGVNDPTWQTGAEWFKTLPPEQQTAKMGPEKYQLWKDGQIKLTDLARMSHSDDWGSAPRVATLQELTTSP